MPRSITDLTSREAVLKALSECKSEGRENFLKKYGFQYSRKYPLVYEGETFDSKAIAGVAYGLQHKTDPLTSREFSGGVSHVVPILRRLGFMAEAARQPAEVLEVGQTYKRMDLLELFGGQYQRGIWTPKEFPAIFIFSGESGAPYGYRDGWEPNGVFRYTGEGTKGDMTFESSGNREIRDHRLNGKDLYLFEDLSDGSGVRFAGLFECASWDEVPGTDKDKKPRKLIVFDLIPVRTAVNSSEGPAPSPSGNSLGDLRKAAYLANPAAPPRRRDSDSKRSWFERSEAVRSYVLCRAQGICEACGNPAPFQKANGTPYLEPHHTTRLSDEGPDHPAWVGAICPNCHRRIHSGADGKDWNEKLQASIAEKESLLGSEPIPGNGKPRKGRA